jgi:hypothetical protein
MLHASERKEIMSVTTKLETEKGKRKACRDRKGGKIIPNFPTLLFTI